MNQKILLGFTLSILLLVMLGLVSYQSIVEFRHSAQSVSNSHKIQNALESLMADLVSAESEARGYVIMGKEEYLTLYRSTAEKTRENLQHLRSMEAQTASPALVERISELIQKRLDRLRMTIDARQTEGLDGVVGIAGAGKKLMDDIRQVAQELEDAEEALLKKADESLKNISRRTTWTIAIGSTLAVLLHIASTVALSRSMTQRHRLERALLETSEREQRRIGQELHDGLCQQLTGISLMVRSLQNDQTPLRDDSLGPIVNLLNESIEETRLVIRGLHPVSEESGGLQLSLRELANACEKNSHIPCELELDGPLPRLDAETASNIYRIAQESVRNSLKHSRCTRIRICLQNAHKRLQLIVEDNGIGFTNPSRFGGFGLEIMKHRAGSIGATLTTGSAGGSGVSVRLTLPLAG